jgi:rhomboid protease GluP
MTSQRFRRTPGTTSIVIAILIGFVIEGFRGGITDGEKLAWLGAVVRELIFEHGQYWRLVSAMFLHGNGTLGGAILHIVTNLVAFMQVGSLFELMFGTRRLLLVYFGAGIAASLTSALIMGGPSVGASGAIFGIFGAFVASVWRSRYWRYHRSARSITNQLTFWIVFNLIAGAMVNMKGGDTVRIDLSAHIGGLIAGALIAAILPRHAPPPPPPARAVIDVMAYDERSGAGPAEHRDDR